MTSSILERVILANSAVDEPDSVTTGSTISERLSKPIDGSQPSLTEKARISSNPVQNVGIETPSRMKTVTTLSSSEYCRMALMMPSGSPISVLKRTAENARRIVVGMRIASS